MEAASSHISMWVN